MIPGATAVAAAPIASGVVQASGGTTTIFTTAATYGYAPANLVANATRRVGVAAGSILHSAQFVNVNAKRQVAVVLPTIIYQPRSIQVYNPSVGTGGAFVSRVGTRIR